MFIKSLHRNLASASFTYFLPLLWLHMTSSQDSFTTLSLENLDDVQRCSELLHQDGLRHHICWILLRTDLYQIDHLIIHDLLSYLVIPYINVLHLLLIPMILSEMNHTLTIAMNSNWILYDTEYPNQSSQPQSFFWRLNCSHVLRLCHWKSNCNLQHCLPTNDTISYCKHIVYRRSSLIKIFNIICINITL